MIPLSLVTQAIRKPKNSLNDSITGPGWLWMFVRTLLDAIIVHASKAAT